MLLALAAGCTTATEMMTKGREALTKLDDGLTKVNAAFEVVEAKVAQLDADQDGKVDLDDLLWVLGIGGAAGGGVAFSRRKKAVTTPTP